VHRTTIGLRHEIINGGCGEIDDFFTFGSGR
jgi:hypothetical protein